MPFRVILSARGKPQGYGVAQRRQVGARPDINRAQHRHRLIRGGVTVIARDAVEASLDILSPDSVERPVHPIAEIKAAIPLVACDSRGSPVGIGGEKFLESVGKRRHPSGFQAFGGWVTASRGASEDTMGDSSRLPG